MESLSQITTYSQYLHPMSVCIYCGPLYHIISYKKFHVADEGLIMDFLRRVFSCRLQHIIQELDVETI